MDEINTFENIVESGAENIENGVPSLDLPIHSMGNLGDLGDLALLKAVVDEDGGMVNDTVEAIETPREDNTEPTPEAEVHVDSDVYMPDDEVLQTAPTTQLEVAIPELSAEKRTEYSTVYSSVVEQITGVSEFVQDELQYDVAFTDGRVDSVRLRAPCTSTQA